MTEERKVLIDLKNIVKSYKNGDQELQVLKGVDLKVYDGEFLAIMGPSGSGKSTLMNIIGLLDRPTSGDYALNGKQVEANPNDTYTGYVRCVRDLSPEEVKELENKNE